MAARSLIACLCSMFFLCAVYVTLSQRIQSRIQSSLCCTSTRDADIASSRGLHPFIAHLSHATRMVTCAITDFFTRTYATLHCLYTNRSIIWRRPSFVDTAKLSYLGITCMLCTASWCEEIQRIPLRTSASSGYAQYALAENPHFQEMYTQYAHNLARVALPHAHHAIQTYVGIDHAQPYIVLAERGAYLERCFLSVERGDRDIEDMCRAIRSEYDELFDLIDDEEKPYLRCALHIYDTASLLWFWFVHALDPLKPDRQHADYEHSAFSEGSMRIVDQQKVRAYFCIDESRALCGQLYPSLLTKNHSKSWFAWNPYFTPRASSHTSAGNEQWGMDMRFHPTHPIILGLLPASHRKPKRHILLGYHEQCLFVKPENYGLWWDGVLWHGYEFFNRNHDRLGKKAEEHLTPDQRKIKARIPQWLKKHLNKQQLKTVCQLIRACKEAEARVEDFARELAKSVDIVSEDIRDVASNMYDNLEEWYTHLHYRTGNELLITPHECIIAALPEDLSHAYVLARRALFTLRTTKTHASAEQAAQALQTVSQSWHALPIETQNALQPLAEWIACIDACSEHLHNDIATFLLTNPHTPWFECDSTARVTHLYTMWCTSDMRTII